jgi:hypothetical protein
VVPKVEARAAAEAAGVAAAAPEAEALSGFLDGILDRRRAEKNANFALKANSPSYKGPRIVAEGDSWFEYPFSEDIVMALSDKYAIFSLAKAGDAWDDVILQNELQKTIDTVKPHIVMLSMGGNEIMGEIERFVFEFQLSRPEDKYIIEADFKQVLDRHEQQLDLHADAILKKDAHLIVHGYDYPDPRDPQEESEGAQWLGPPLKHLRGIDNRPLWRKIVNTMVNQLNARIQKVANKEAFRDRMHYVDLRKTVGTDDTSFGPDRSLWNDEIHPTTEGFQKLAAKIGRKIDQIHPLTT